MPVQTDTYYSLTCSGKIDNLLQPTCPMRSRGVFNDQDAARKLAWEDGWTAPTEKTDLCPTHSLQAQASGGPIRRPRPVKPVQPIEQQVPDQNQQ